MHSCVRGLLVVMLQAGVMPPHQTGAPRFNDHDQRNQNLRCIHAPASRAPPTPHSRLSALRSQFKERSCATNVEVILPLPSDATAPTTRCTQGSSQYVPEKSALVWHIKNFPGGKEFQMR